MGLKSLINFTRARLAPETALLFGSVTLLACYNRFVLDDAFISFRYAYIKLSSGTAGEPSRSYHAALNYIDAVQTCTETMSINFEFMQIHIETVSINIVSMQTRIEQMLICTIVISIARG